MSGTQNSQAVAEYREGVPAPSRRMEVMVAAVALAIIVSVVLLAQQIELRRESAPGQIDARFWPTVLGCTGAVAALWRLALVLRGGPVERDDLERVQPGGAGRLAMTLLLSVVYVALWEQRTVVAAGFQVQVFPVVTVLLLAGLTWLYGGRGWRALILFPVGATALIYVLFHTLLRIPL